MSDENLFCLTLDLENDWYFDEPGYDHLTLEYLDDFIKLFKNIDVPLSIFVVGETIQSYPDEIQRLNEQLECEFHLHSHQHDTSKSYDFRTEIQRGKIVFEEHFGKLPQGYRAPQGNIDLTELKILEEEGFMFDSSIFPSYRPGVYNNLDKPLEPYSPEITDNLLEIPLGVFKGIRIPVSHSYFKLFGGTLSRYLSYSPLPNNLIYNVHLQDLYQTESHEKLPFLKKHIMLRNINNSEYIIENNISRILERGYRPCTISDIVSKHT